MIVIQIMVMPAMIVLTAQVMVNAGDGGTGDDGACDDGAGD